MEGIAALHEGDFEWDENFQEGLIWTWLYTKNRNGEYAIQEYAAPLNEFIKILWREEKLSSQENHDKLTWIYHNILKRK